MFVKPAKCCSLEFLGFRSFENFFAQICEYFWSQLTIGTLLLEIRVEFLDSVDVLPTDIGYLGLQVGLMAVLVTHFVVMNNHTETEMIIVNFEGLVLSAIDIN